MPVRFDLMNDFFDGSQVNLFPNARFESGVLLAPDFVDLATGVSDASKVSADPPVIEGGWSLELTVAANTGPTVSALLLSYVWLTPAEPGQVFSACVTAAFADDGLAPLLGLGFYDASKAPVILGGSPLLPGAPLLPSPLLLPGGGVVTQFTTGSSGMADPQELENDMAIAPPTTAYIGLVLGVVADETVHRTGTIKFDEVMLSPTIGCPPFFDGLTGGAEFMGARWYSPSFRLGESDEMAFIKSLCPPYWYDDTVEGLI
jgi:hypothetical protein